MWLYRVMLATKDGSEGMFYDATASLEEAIRTAKIIQRREPHFKVTVEAEDWPNLTWLKYQYYKLMGLNEGFGVNFTKKYDYAIGNIKTVWPPDGK